MTFDCRELTRIAQRWKGFDDMESLYLGDILHTVTYGFLIPDMVILVLLILYTVFQAGSFAVEFFGERRHFKLVMPDFLNALDRASADDIPHAIEESGMLKDQQDVLKSVYDNRHLPSESRFGLAQRQIYNLSSHYARISGRVDAAAKIAPMFGLMGTLIPLGPGIVALGKGDPAALSSSLLIAFDTTVAGLMAAAFCFLIARVRKRWYDDYMMAVKTASSSLLEKLELLEEEGEVFVAPQSGTDARSTVVQGEGNMSAAAAGEGRPRAATPAMPTDDEGCEGGSSFGGGARRASAARAVDGDAGGDAEGDMIEGGGAR